jgi:hypothetical protein
MQFLCQKKEIIPDIKNHSNKKSGKFFLPALFVISNIEGK